MTPEANEETRVSVLRCWPCLQRVESISHGESVALIEIEVPAFLTIGLSHTLLTMADQLWPDCDITIKGQCRDLQIVRTS